MRKILAALIFLCFFIGCSNKQQTNNKVTLKQPVNNEEIPLPPPPIYFSKSFFPSYFSKDTLIIEAQYSECGEWGGHKEMIKVFAKDTTFFAEYFKFTTDCSMDKYGNLSLKKEKHITCEITESDKEALRNYFHQLLSSKITERSGMRYDCLSIRNTDSSLLIKVYDISDVDWKNFESLIVKVVK
jgi:hypothetical protein